LFLLKEKIMNREMWRLAAHLALFVVVCAVAVIYVPDPSHNQRQKGPDFPEIDSRLKSTEVQPEVRLGMLAQPEDDIPQATPYLPRGYAAACNPKGCQALFQLMAPELDRLLFDLRDHKTKVTSK
jgi:hypothetical protein